MIGTAQVNETTKWQSTFSTVSQKHAYIDWTVVSQETIPNIDDLHTTQIAPSGLKFVVHHAMFCTIIMPCDPYWNVTLPEENGN